MNFFIDGDTIGLTITSIWVVLLILWISLEIASFLTTRIFLIHKIYLSLIVIIKLKKILPLWWKLKWINFFTIRKYYKSHTNIFVEISSKVTKGEIIYYFLEVDLLGRLTNTNALLERLSVSDKTMISEIRDYKLNKIKNL